MTPPSIPHARDRHEDAPTPATMDAADMGRPEDEEDAAAAHAANAPTKEEEEEDAAGAATTGWSAATAEEEGGGGGPDRAGPLPGDAGRRQGEEGEEAAICRGGGGNGADRGGRGRCNPWREARGNGAGRRKRRRY